jgi:transposase
MEKRLYSKYEGIDVSKEKLDVYESEGRRYYQVENSKSGIKELRKVIKKEEVGLVVIDLRGGYERGVVSELDKGGYKLHLAQGKR